VLRYTPAVGRPKLHDDALRIRLLDRAAELLSEGGPDALSLRRLAGDVGTSTTAVYSLFGGKAGLLQAVYDEAFRRFGEHLATGRPNDGPPNDGPPGDGPPGDGLWRLALAYRASALDDPHMYAVMFGRRASGFVPNPEGKERAAATFQPLVDAVRRGIDAGRLPKDDPVTLATACWATAHGLVSLEIGGFLPPEAGDPTKLYGAAVRAVASGWGRRDRE
jgi:AcrR family transcriptional regulator